MFETRNLRSILFLPTLCLLVAACGGPQDVTSEEPTAIGFGEPWVVSGAVTTVGELGGPDDEADEIGFYRDQRDVTFEIGSTVRLSVESSDFDTTIRVEGPDGMQLYNDDYWDGTNSMVQFQADSAAPYRLIVSSYASRSTGAYTVRASVFDPSKIAPIVLLGDSFTGRVSPVGSAGGGGASAGVWFEARAGQRFRLRVTSPSFDTTARLFGPSGQSWFNDDANDTGEDGSESTLDSTIEGIAPSDGWYQLVVAPYGGVAQGTFTLVTSYRPPVTVAPGQAVPEMGYAGTRTEGRMYGIFVGITDYGPGDQLFGCVDDATFLAEAFRHRHLQAAEDQVVLTNKTATRANFERAVRRIADKAGPDDMVVIFYSGHGGILPVDQAADRVELDGTDETLIFVDEHMRDNDFARSLDLFATDSLLVAIDSCQSGGFARDIMTRPGRIGIFSSDEDVLSATAEPVGAGGYLSYMMRQAVLGHADNRPHDGAMLAGELADYMIETAFEQHRNMNPAGSTDPLQRILIERGSYNWADTLWVFPRSEAGVAFDEDLCLETPPQGGSAQGSTCR